jgi:CHAT domain-containing protein
MRYLILTYLLTNLVYASPSPFDQAQQTFDQGQFEQAIQNWQEVLKNTKDLASYLEAQIGLAATYHALGAYQEAFDILKKSLPAAQSMKEDQTWQVKILMGLGDYYLLLQQKEKAEPLLQEAESMARQLKQPLLLAQVLNKQGNRLTMALKIPEATSAYKESLELAKRASDSSLIARIKLNLALVLPKRPVTNQQALLEMEEALKITLALSPASHLKSTALIALSQLPKTFEDSKSKSDQFTNEQRQKSLNITLLALEEAQTNAKQTGDNRTLSYALGLKGELYEKAGRYDEALRLTRQALFVAQQTPRGTPLPVVQSKSASCTTKTSSIPASPLPELTYRWYWQLGRLFKSQYHWDEAIKMYQFAVDQLKFVRKQLSETGYRLKPSFKENLAPLYLELIELLFQRATDAGNQGLAKDQQDQLQAAQQIIERFKGDEIKDYFQQECFFANENQASIEENLSTDTAVLYPIFLAKETQLKLLLKLSTGLYLFDAPVLGKIAHNATVLRGNLAKPSDTQRPFQTTEANTLYNWLITPIAAKLETQHIHTLIIVPDGVLRTIPFAVLHDGKKFLMEKYILASVQNLELTNGEKTSTWEDAQVLLGGVSKRVDKELSPLPKVKDELIGIQNSFPHNSVQLLDEPFIDKNLEDNLKQTSYNIIHVASHASFGNDPNDSKQTFLLTYRDRVTLNRLEELIRLRKSGASLELMTLSACETAKGDDQAALGLAGITLKSGAKSALASLWQVNDEATAKLMTEFYRQLLQQPQLTKAEALQRAQLTLRKDYPHPYYWAAFLIIGNWL